MSNFSDPLLPLPFYPGTTPRFHAMVKPTAFTLNRFRPGSAEPFATVELFK